MKMKWMMRTKLQLGEVRSIVDQSAITLTRNRYIIRPKMTMTRTLLISRTLIESMMRMMKMGPGVNQGGTIGN